LKLKKVLLKIISYKKIINIFYRGVTINRSWLLKEAKKTEIHEFFTVSIKKQSWQKILLEFIELSNGEESNEVKLLKQ